VGSDRDIDICSRKNVEGRFSIKACDPRVDDLVGDVDKLAEGA
jgi:hypothetical protein